MNQPPNPQWQTTLPRNTLGVVGFVFSLLGVVTCGVLGPVGLLLSLLGLFRRPRGFALAGTIISLLATLWLGAVGAVVVTGVTRLGPAVESFADEFGEAAATLSVVAQASQDLQRYRDEQGDWPDQKTGQELVGRLQDAYGTALQYTRVGELVLIISAGADREFATADDISLDPQTMATTQPGTKQAIDFDD
jgi:hypothetical protein